jgi:hypothetical protein
VYSCYWHLSVLQPGCFTSRRLLLHTITMLALRRTITLLRMRALRLPCQISVTLCIRYVPQWSCGLFQSLSEK